MGGKRKRAEREKNEKEVKQPPVKRKKRLTPTEIVELDKKTRKEIITDLYNSLCFEIDTNNHQVHKTLHRWSIKRIFSVFTTIDKLETHLTGSGHLIGNQEHDEYLIVNLCATEELLEFMYDICAPHSVVSNPGIFSTRDKTLFDNEDETSKKKKRAVCFIVRKLVNLLNQCPVTSADIAKNTTEKKFNSVFGFEKGDHILAVVIKILEKSTGKILQECNNAEVNRIKNQFLGEHVYRFSDVNQTLWYEHLLQITAVFVTFCNIKNVIQTTKNLVYLLLDNVLTKSKEVLFGFVPEIKLPARFFDNTPVLFAEMSEILSAENMVCFNMAFMFLDQQHTLMNNAKKNSTTVKFTASVSLDDLGRINKNNLQQFFDLLQRYAIRQPETAPEDLNISETTQETTQETSMSQIYEWLGIRLDNSDIEKGVHLSDSIRYLCENFRFVPRCEVPLDTVTFESLWREICDNKMCSIIDLEDLSDKQQKEQLKKFKLSEKSVLWHFVKKYLKSAHKSRKLQIVSAKTLEETKPEILIPGTIFSAGDTCSDLLRKIRYLCNSTALSDNPRFRAQQWRSQINKRHCSVTKEDHQQQQEQNQQTNSSQLSPQNLPPNLDTQTDAAFSKIYEAVNLYFSWCR
jgi:hypothetical protein